MGSRGKGGGGGGAGGVGGAVAQVLALQVSKTWPPGRMAVNACWRKVQLPCEDVLQTSEAEPVTEAITLARMGESKSEPVHVADRQVSTLA